MVNMSSWFEIAVTPSTFRFKLIKQRQAVLPGPTPPQRHSRFWAFVFLHSDLFPVRTVSAPMAGPKAYLPDVQVHYMWTEVSRRCWHKPPSLLAGNLWRRSQIPSPANWLLDASILDARSCARSCAHSWCEAIVQAEKVALNMSWPVRINSL